VFVDGGSEVEEAEIWMKGGCLSIRKSLELYFEGHQGHSFTHRIWQENLLAG